MNKSETTKNPSPHVPHLVHSWMNPSCEKRRTTYGFGLFARHRIQAGTLIIIQGGHVMPIFQEPSLPDEMWDLPLQISDEFMIGPREPHDIEDVDFINHSCDPNAGWKGQIFLFAMRDIEGNEQICFDYATAVSVPDYGFDCMCGAQCCRGRLTSKDWMLPELQMLYRGWFQHYLQEKIDAALAHK
jgi:SET domain-containing protein